MGLERLTIGVSPLTNKIYAGYPNAKDRRRFDTKIDVTDQVLNAVVAHMCMSRKENEEFDGYQFSGGILRWEPAEETAEPED